MERLAAIIFAPLNGEPPAGEAADLLPAAESVAAVVRAAFGPFLAPNGAFQFLSGRSPVVPPPAGLFLVYAYGHAWAHGHAGAEDHAETAAAGPRTSVRVGEGSVIEDAANLLARRLPAGAADRAILILDCCHAAAFAPFLPQGGRPRLAVYACGAAEKALAFPGERASRLALAFRAALSGRHATVDLAAATAAVAGQLERDGVVAGQSVGYAMHGAAIRLQRGAVAVRTARERTVARIRNLLLGTGAVAAAGLAVVGWYYHRHALIEIDFADLAGIASDIRLMATEEHPDTNGSRIFADEPVSGNRRRIWVPASNVILRVEARYQDGARRALAFHRTLSPGFAPREKWIELALPPAAEILRHPDMAYIPATQWFRGRERTPRTNPHPFWIDIRPPTVREYRALAEQRVQEGRLDPADSFLLSAAGRSAAVDAVGLGQLRSLNRDLGDIFGTIAAGTEQHVTAPGDLAVGLGSTLCLRCPAPMTPREALAYCQSRNARLPTDLEWELAVRGVDGRDYPWGSRFDNRRANVPGLPAKGAPPPTLQPVDAYPGQRSPFGLIDTVGNAGDWVADEPDAEPDDYMGATYRYNPEDATAFRLLPFREAAYPIREITARCVMAPARGNGAG